jgi:hypothetical protein
LLFLFNSFIRLFRLSYFHCIFQYTDFKLCILNHRSSFPSLKSVFQ